MHGKARGAILLSIASEADTVDIQAFLGGKTHLARALAAGECGGKYEDAILIISSVFSAFSSLFWPRPGDDPDAENEQATTETAIAVGGQPQIAKSEPNRKQRNKWSAPDAKRFIEFWVTYAEPTLGSNRVSVPLLANSALQHGDHVSLNALKAIRPRLLRHAPAQIEWEVATGDDDADEAEIVVACPNLGLKNIRRWSYPAIFYRDVRSAYVHELSPGAHASPIPGGKSGAPITYRNFADPPRHRIYFEVDWLCRIAESCARLAYPDWQKSSKRCAIKWWIDGA